MSTTRHRRRSWQQIGLETTIGILIGADAVCTIHARNGLVRLGTLALGVISAALLLGASTWVCSIAWHNGRHRYLVHAAAFTPLRRPLYPISSERQDEPTDVPLHYGVQADHWRQDGPKGPEPIPVVRPYVPPLAATTAADGPA